MKQGRYFCIPEGPDDMARLWEQSVPLRRTALPSWLTPEDIPSYRELRSPSSLPLSSTDRETYSVELEELEEIGLIVEEDPSHAGVDRVFMEAPKVEEIWSIGLYSGNSPTQLQPSAGISNPILTREHVTDVSASFVADPFMVREAGIWHMFFEVMNWKSRKGEIGWATSADGIAWKYRQIVLAEEFHLSYPYVFEWRGSYFMVPESFQAGAVRLYRATRFPTQWLFMGTLIEGEYLADPSVFQYAGKWWMFVDASPDEQNDTLRLFAADDLTGRWREHPKSPIVQGDPHNARPAGRVLVGEGRLIRYAQNCVPAYGTDVRCFKVTELTSTQYREQRLGKDPILGSANSGWNAGGMHHVDPHCLGEGRWIACVDGWFLPGQTTENSEILESERGNELE